MIGMLFNWFNGCYHFGGDYLDRMIERCRNVKGTPRIKWQLDIATDNLNRALHRKIIR